MEVVTGHATSASSFFAIFDLNSDSESSLPLGIDLIKLAIISGVPIAIRSPATISANLAFKIFTFGSKVFEFLTAINLTQSLS
jgi:hypothetical protein